MSRLLAYIANDPQRIRCALHAGREALREAASGGAVSAIDSWGFGFHQNGEVLLQRRPRHAGAPVDFYALCAEVRTDVLIGHMRHATVGATKNENTHPFRFRQWVFAHHGTIGAAAGEIDADALTRFAALRGALLEHIPDFLRRNIRGETDSEHLFHLFLSQLHKAGKLDDALVSVEVAGRALAETIQLCDEVAGHGAWTADCAASNGRILLASARGAPMHTYQVSGIRECPVCREAPIDASRAGTRPFEHDHLRAVVLVADEALAEPRPPWREVPPGSLVTVNHELQLRITPLGG